MAVYCSVAIEVSTWTHIKLTKKLNNILTRKGLFCIFIDNDSQNHIMESWARQKDSIYQ